MDSAFHTRAAITACRRADVRFSVTARTDPKITREIAGISQDAWTPIKYPHAIFDEDEQRWISDAEVAEIEFTAFSGRRRAEHVTARAQNDPLLTAPDHLPHGPDPRTFSGRAGQTGRSRMP